jgi:hypothetical protein
MGGFRSRVGFVSRRWCRWVLGGGSCGGIEPEKANDLPLREVERRTRLKPVRYEISTTVWSLVERIVRKCARSTSTRQLGARPDLEPTRDWPLDEPPVAGHCVVLPTEGDQDTATDAYIVPDGTFVVADAALPGTQCAPTHDADTTES